jgi:hypothetical protein
VTLAVRSRRLVHLAGAAGTLCGVKRVRWSPRTPFGDVTCRVCRSRAAQGSVVYLIHFDRPFSHAQHYIGWTENLPFRIGHHLAGTGANLLRHVNEAGIPWSVVRVWPGASRGFERRLKGHSATRNCPICATAPQKEKHQ